MATKIFENIIENNLEGKIPSKGQTYTQKSDLSEFRNLIKNQTTQSKTSDYKSEQKRIKANEHQQVSETNNPNHDSAELYNNAHYSSNIQSPKITAHPIEETISVIEIKDNITQEEAFTIEGHITQELDLIASSNLLAEEHDKEAEFLDIVDSAYNKENIVIPVSSLDSNKFEAFENANNEIETVPIVPESLIIPKLSDQDNQAHQQVKTFELPNGFIPEDLVKRTEILTDKLQSQIPSTHAKGLNELTAMSAKLDMPIKLTINDESGKNIIEDTTKILIAPSLNLALADPTRHGKEVISRMQGARPTDEQILASASEIEGFVLDNEAPFFNFSDKNDNNAAQKKSLSLEAFGAVTEQINDETFEITFDGNNNNLKRSEIPKPTMQVSLAVKEVSNLTSDSGKKQITINLHPHSLGAIKVEILSQLGQGGVSKIESIKISADKHETLVMLEERKAELSRSLKEVNGAQEKETSLQFEMSQDQSKGQGTYFASLEERDNWMSKFAGLISDAPIEEKQVHIVDEYATRGILTEDKVDLIA